MFANLNMELEACKFLYVLIWVIVIYNWRCGVLVDIIDPHQPFSALWVCPSWIVALYWDGSLLIERGYTWIIISIAQSSFFEPNISGPDLGLQWSQGLPSTASYRYARYKLDNCWCTFLICSKSYKLLWKEFYLVCTTKFSRNDKCLKKSNNFLLPLPGLLFTKCCFEIEIHTVKTFIRLIQEQSELSLQLVFQVFMILAITA